jgi:hypothetical protein
MLSISTKLQVIGAAAVLALGANVGIASALAKTHTEKTKTHHVDKSHKTKHAKHSKKKKKTAKKATKQVVAEASNVTPSRKRKTPPPTTTTTTTTTTPTTTTTTSTTPPTDPTTAAGTPQPAGISGNWNLILNSEFNGSTYDSSIWRTGVYTPNGGMSGPGSTYEDDCYSPNNVTFPGDDTMHLNLTDQSSSCVFDGGAITEPFTGSMLSTNPDDGRTSGGFQYTYGVLEARVYVPGSGSTIADWPAVWTDSHNWPMTGEDDIFEGLGGQACYHFHYGTSAADAQSEGGCDVDLTPGWHTFASDWQPGSVTYYYDGQKVGQLTSGITDAPMYIVLQNSTGDQSWNGPTEADSMQVSYVRVWQSS